MAALARFLVPFCARAAGFAGPFGCLDFEPSRFPVFPDVIQIWFLGPVMGPRVGHALPKRWAGAFGTGTTEIDFFLQGTIPEFTIPDGVVRRRFSSATGTVFCPAGAAEQTTGPR